MKFWLILLLIAALPFLLALGSLLLDLIIEFLLLIEEKIRGW